MSTMSALHAELTAAAEPMDPTDGLLTPAEARALVTPAVLANPDARMRLKIRLMAEANAWHAAGYPDVAMAIGVVKMGIPMRLASERPAPVFPVRVPISMAA
jgi:hypothetical protein